MQAAGVTVLSLKYPVGHVETHSTVLVRKKLGLQAVHMLPGLHVKQLVVLHGWHMWVAVSGYVLTGQSGPATQVEFVLTRNDYHEPEVVQAVHVIVDVVQVMHR